MIGCSEGKGNGFRSLATFQYYITSLMERVTISLISDSTLFLNYCLFDEYEGPSSHTLHSFSWKICLTSKGESCTNLQ
jgi:hypothetical protein